MAAAHVAEHVAEHFAEHTTECITSQSTCNTRCYMFAMASMYHGMPCALHVVVMPACLHQPVAPGQSVDDMLRLHFS